MEKTYEPKAFEQRLYDKWQREGYFKAKPSKKAPFTIVMPPPNITGQLHIGHALDNAVQDAITRYKRMQGFEALWLPGTDHASIATEVKIVEKMKQEGLTKADLGREGFLKRAFAWKDNYGGRIVEQLKKLGSSCDWDRLAFTMDDKCSRAVRSVFVSLYEKGLIYRGDRIINWCPKCKTAISDAEVEHKTESSHLWHIIYPIENSSDTIVVATTRPETMLGDTAVAVNPADKRYAHLVGKNVLLPLTDRKIPVIADDYVDVKFGTGAVKITPAHDPNDFEVGLRHSLPVIKVMTDDGIMADNAGDFKGQDRFVARKNIVASLQQLGALKKIEKHAHNVGHCYRCDSAIEPMVSKQWFVKMEPLAGPAIDVVKNKDTQFLPRRFEKIYLHWMENIRDWCISRQLWWGHRIPAYYCDACGHMQVSEKEVAVCEKCGAPVRQDEDVLDTWFSSALWPFSTLGYPEKTEDLDFFYPTSVLVTAYDIIFFWVARMIFSGVEHMGEAPFKHVLIHGIVRDEQGRKMSKSLGNGIDPLEIIEKYGADSLRFSLVNGISAGGDIRYSTDKLEGYRNFLNKIWNAARFVLMNCENVKLEKDLSKLKLSLADKWILTRLNECIADVTKYMDKYEVGLAAAKLYDFIWSVFCDWYIELSKPRLYTADEDVRAATVNVLLYVLRQCLKLVHPIIPFITAEIFDNLPGRDAEDIMISAYPKTDKKLVFKKESAEMESIMSVIRSIRSLRQEMNAGQRRTAIYLVPKKGSESLVKAGAEYVEKLASGSRVDFYKPDVKCAFVASDLCDIYIPMGELVDFKQERERLQKELANILSELKRAEGKLANKGFADKAPPELIAAEREKVEKYSALKVKTEQGLKELATELGENS